MRAWNKRKRPKHHTKTKVIYCWIIERNVFYSRNIKNKEIIFKVLFDDTTAKILGILKVPSFIVYKKSEKRRKVDIRFLKERAGNKCKERYYKSKTFNKLCRMLALEKKKKGEFNGLEM